MQQLPLFLLSVISHADIKQYLKEFIESISLFDNGFTSLIFISLSNLPLNQLLI